MSKLWIHKIDNLPPVYYQDIAPSVNYEDKSSDIEAWNLYGKYVLNYKGVRDKIFHLILAIVSNDFSTYSNLTTAQKLLAAKWCCSPYALRVPSEQTEDQDIKNWNRLIVETNGLIFKGLTGRSKVIEVMRQYIANELRVETISKSESSLFTRDTLEMSQWFIFGNTSDLHKWLTNEVGSSYENAGFAETTYYSVQRKDDLVELYYGYYS